MSMVCITCKSQSKDILHTPLLQPPVGFSASDTTHRSLSYACNTEDAYVQVDIPHVFRCDGNAHGIDC